MLVPIVSALHAAEMRRARAPRQRTPWRRPQGFAPAAACKACCGPGRGVCGRPGIRNPTPFQALNGKIFFAPALRASAQPPSTTKKGRPEAPFSWNPVSEAVAGWNPESRNPRPQPPRGEREARDANFAADAARNASAQIAADVRANHAEAHRRRPPSARTRAGRQLGENVATSNSPPMAHAEE